MLTDDPGTPGNGNFELNLATTIEGTGQERSWELPNFDLNFGVGSNIQLNVESAFVLQKRAGHGAIGGLGAASVAVKWRFFDEGNGGLAISTYPRIERSIFDASVRHGLVDPGTRFFLPLEAARTFGPIKLGLETGSLLGTIGRSEWDYGIVAGASATHTLDLMAEIHGSARANFSDDRLTLNVGLHQSLDKSVAIIASIGHDVRSPPGQPLALVSYFGLQLEF